MAHEPVQQWGDIRFCFWLFCNPPRAHYQKTGFALLKVLFLTQFGIFESTHSCFARGNQHDQSIARSTRNYGRFHPGDRRSPVALGCARQLGAARCTFTLPVLGPVAGWGASSPSTGSLEKQPGQAGQDLRSSGQAGWRPVRVDVVYL